MQAADHDEPEARHFTRTETLGSRAVTYRAASTHLNTTRQIAAGQFHFRSVELS